MENETDEVVSGVSTLSMAVERSGPLSFADVCDLGAEVAGRLADQHEDGSVHGHVGVGSVVRLDDGPWRLAPADLVPDVEPVLAPELQSGAAPTPAGDVYALGAVLSYGLTGVAVEPVAPTSAAGSADLEPSDLEPSDADQSDAEDDPDADPSGADGVDAAAGGRIGTDPEGEPTLELTAEDLDRLRTFGDAAPAAVDEAGEAEPGPDPDDTAAIDLTDERAEADGDDAPVTLPEVMSSFLVVLRSSLADDPADRPSASDLAATMRQLRSDADSALGGALVGGVAAVVIGDGTAGAEAWDEPASYADAPPPPLAAASVAGAGAAGALTVEGTGATASLGAAAGSKTTKKSMKDRVPVLVAVAAILVAAFLGVSLVRERDNKDSDLLAVGPTVGTVVHRSTTTSPPALPVDLIVETTTTLPTSTTTSTTSTTAPPTREVPVETTAPTTAPPTTEAPTTLPPTTLPPTTTTTPSVPFKQATVTCLTPAKTENPCQLFASADATSSPRSGPLANGLALQATCIKKGVAPFPGALDTWLLIIGPAPTYSGWLSATHLGGSIPTVPPCAANQTP